MITLPGIKLEILTVVIGIFLPASALTAAKRAQLSRGESGPLKPKDLLDARERLAISGAVPQLSSSSGRAPGVGGSARKSLLGGRSALMRRDAI